MTRTVAPPWLQYGPGTAAFAPRKDHRWLLAGLLAAVVVAALIVALVYGVLAARRLDIAAVQAGVAHVLSDPAGYGARNVSDVKCNDGQNPTIARGNTFTCEATIDRVKRVFVVTLTDDAGSYQVGRAR
ncbi:DUF4333 domain-containing protein [Mycobacterium conspicuum]|uniref:DUF4333 domain-containing protein n=1 Tax=Mycobacterium conspicuum TaxID=44010 RepID=UPI000A160349|nr:DUF4333 domain-containing protein [Mycobacterium conspicuum]